MDVLRVDMHRDGCAAMAVPRGTILGRGSSAEAAAGRHHLQCSLQASSMIVPDVTTCSAASSAREVSQQHQQAVDPLQTMGLPSCRTSLLAVQPAGHILMLHMIQCVTSSEIL